jgi:hypothetical protein
MMHLYKEITQWGSNEKCNHVYVFKDKPNKRIVKAIGYIRQGTDDYYEFKKPLDLDLKGRNFIKVGLNNGF